MAGPLRIVFEETGTIPKTKAGFDATGIYPLNPFTVKVFWLVIF